MNTHSSMEERLWNFIDGLAEESEKDLVGRLIREEAAWKQKHAELLEIKSLLTQSRLEAPSLRFTRNVMEKLADIPVRAAGHYINKNVIRGILGFFLVVITALLIYGFGLIDWSAKSEKASPVDLTKVDYSRIFNSDFVNIFLGINILLALFLLDRFLTARRRHAHEKTM